MAAWLADELHPTRVKRYQGGTVVSLTCIIASHMLRVFAAYCIPACETNNLTSRQPDSSRSHLPISHCSSFSAHRT